MHRYTLAAAVLALLLAAFALVMLGDFRGDRVGGDRDAPALTGSSAAEPSSPRTTSPPDGFADEARDAPTEASSPNLGPAASLRDRIAAAQQSLEQARVRRSAAREELAQAEAEMEQIERQVEEVERFVEDLERRGEDPTRHADEGLALLHPTLERYRQTADRIARAQRTIDAANGDLAEAERTLADLREEALRD